MKSTALRLLAALLIIGSFVTVLLPAQVAHAAVDDWYVSINGSDAGAGTESDPWRYINYAASQADAGDTIYVMSGNYNESVTFSNSGNSTNCITLKNYENDRVVIDGTGVSGNYGLVSCYSQQYIIIDGFEIANAGDATHNYSGVFVGFYVPGTSMGHIVIRNCKIHYTQNSGIRVISGWTAPYAGRLTDITIDNVETYDTNQQGDQEAISLQYVDDFEVKNSYIHDTDGSESSIGVDKEGICAKVACTNGSIHDNEISHTRYGIYIGGDESDNIDIYNNYVHDNDDGTGNGSGIGLSDEKGDSLVDHTVTDINIYNNIIANNAVNGFSVLNYTYTIQFTLINNTFYKNGDIRDIYLGYEPAYSGCVIRNNIFYEDPSVSVLVVATADQAGLTMTHNLFWDGDATILGYLGTTTYLVDPQLSDPANEAFDIKVSSPARDAGLATGAPTSDYLGTVRPQGTAWDIGAYEYTTLTPAPTVVPPPSSDPGLERMRIFRNLLDTGDQLMVWIANIPYDDGTPTYTVGDAYTWQLIDTDGVTVIGYITGFAYHEDGYGYNVYSMYYDSTDGFVWGTAYTLRLTGNPGVFTTPPTEKFVINVDSYTTLTDSDDNREALADEVIYLAKFLNTKWELTGEDSLLLETEVGTVLSLEGETVFRGCIFGIQGMAPQAFRFVVGEDTLGTDERTWTSNYTDILADQYSGTWIETARNASIDFLGADYDLMGVGLLFACCAGLVIGNMALTQDHWNGLIDVAFVLVIATRIGILGLVICVLLMAVAFIYMGMRLWKMIPQ
jgi:parallel beta-helix repeat protein